MLPQEIIRKKRNKQHLSQEEINSFIKAIVKEEVVDAQISSLTMAIFLNGMKKDEIVNLTLAMRDSGDVLKWQDKPIIDKHSSGGVGDKISLMLAPMLAACGGYVPMISGRGLGHTGGTLDKFDSIPGYNTLPSNKLFTKTVKEIGYAIIGQTGNLAPADKKIYAIRDISATVESIPLITASILSKKLAAGLDCLVMDLKCGNGAFMSNIKDARALAKSIVSVANQAGTKTSAIITDMNQVLGSNVGNALEMQEAVDYLKNKNIDPRLHQVNMELCKELLISAKLAKSPQEAEAKLQKSLDSGKALEIFAKMVSALGGPKDFTDKPEKYLPKAKIIKPVFAKKEGYVSSMKTRDIGLSIIGLKGGRITPDQKLDYSTGFSSFCQVGDKLDKNTPIAIIHAKDDAQYKKAALELQESVEISSKKPKLSKTVLERIK